MPPEDVCSISGWLSRDDQQLHVRFFKPSASFAMVAGRTGCDNIRPNVHPTQVTWQDMVNRQVGPLMPTVLAGIIVPAEHLSTAELHVWARAVDHVIEADDGWARKAHRDRLDDTPAIGNQRGFTGEHQPDRSSCVANIDWLEIGV